MDDLSFWLNKPPPPREGREGEEAAEAPPRHFASARPVSLAMVRPTAHRAQHRRPSQLRAVLPDVPSIPSAPFFASLAELAAVRLPKISQPVFVAGSVAAFVALTAVGFGANDKAPVASDNLTMLAAAERPTDLRASRSEPVVINTAPPAQSSTPEVAQVPDEATSAVEATPQAPTTPPAPTTPAPPKPTAKPPAKPAPAPKPTAPKATTIAGPIGDDVWTKLANCEAGGRNDTGAPYYGFFQFSAQTWKSVGGTGLPNEHSYEVQKAKAIELQKRSGWGQWPSCSSKLGLR